MKENEVLVNDVVQIVMKWKLKRNILKLLVYFQKGSMKNATSITFDALFVIWKRNLTSLRRTRIQEKVVAAKYVTWEIRIEYLNGPKLQKQYNPNNRKKLLERVFRVFAASATMETFIISGGLG